MFSPETAHGAFEDDVATKRPTDEHTQKTLAFVQKHESSLMNIDRSTRSAIAECPSSHYRAVQLAVDPLERVLPQDIVNTTTAGENEVLKKALVVLIYICDEINELKEIAETKLYASLVMFGQKPLILSEGAGRGTDDSATFKPGEREQMIGNFLVTLQEVSNFIDRCYVVAVNLVQQLSQITEASEVLYKSTFHAAHLIEVYQALGQLLTILVTLDNAVRQNDVLQEAWSYYKSMTAYARSDPVTFGADEAKISKFERMLVSIDQKVMSGDIFKGCIEQDFEIIRDDDNYDEEPLYRDTTTGTAADVDEGEEETNVRVCVRGNDIFLEELVQCISTILENSLATIGTFSELSERYDIVSCYALYALYRRLLPRQVIPDKKFYRTLWSVQKSVPLVVLYQKVVWAAGEFMVNFAPFDVNNLDPLNPSAYSRQYVTQFDQVLSGKTSALLSQCAAWFALAESRLQPSLRHEHKPQQALDIRGSIILKGLALAHRTAYLAKSCLILHSFLQVPLSKTNLTDVTLLLENLKAIEYTFVRKDAVISEFHMHSLRGLLNGIREIVQPLRRKHENDSRRDQPRLDFFAALSIVEKIVMTSDSLPYSRQVALHMATEVITTSKLFDEKEVGKLRIQVARAAVLANFSRELKVACDTSFMYHHLDIIEPIVEAIYQQPTEANRLQYILGAFSDAARNCELVKHIDGTVLIAGYQAYIEGVLRRQIIEPLCREVETDLRLHIHAKNLDHMQALNPKAENLQPIRPFLEAAPIRILGTMIYIKEEVEHYLDRTFYNLTTVALHDWRTYADMRSLAQEKLGVKLMDSFLPMGSLEQGLDVLQIMRNIHIFVSRFSYNMNMQLFVEFKPDRSSKHLNTIKIQSIAASLRQHGLGVLNTTVNFTYKFLSQKFNIFSQFLYDDYIRGHLSREHRWFKKHRSDPEVNNMYPYARALKFVKDIRRLGVDESGKSFLDQFRILITEIGNALGYIRMVRSASMYYFSEAVKFLPEVDSNISFEQHAGKGVPLPSADTNTSKGGEVGLGFTPGSGANLSTETIRAGKNLDEVIGCLVKNFGEGSDYFKVLVNVFQSVLLSADHDHLRSFFVIVPALCISWTDASLQAKDNMYKASVARGPIINSSSASSAAGGGGGGGGGGGKEREMYFTDDGFAMGVAYCLAILKQTKKFDALQWFDNVRLKLQTDSKQHEEMQARRASRETTKKNSEHKQQKTKNKGEKAENSNNNNSSIVKFFFGSSSSPTSPSSSSSSFAAGVDGDAGQGGSRGRGNSSRGGGGEGGGFGEKEGVGEGHPTEEDYDDLEEIHALQTTGKRLEAHRRETEQLFYSMSGAGIFFKRTDVDT